jgi:hypothetical protein
LKNKANSSSVLSVTSVAEKTKPVHSYCVRRTAYCVLELYEQSQYEKEYRIQETEFVKQSQLLKRYRLWCAQHTLRLWLKKQSQFLYQKECFFNIIAGVLKSGR